VNFVPVAGRNSRFVLCLNCETAFAPECLDESSTAELAELEITVPGFAYREIAARGRQRGRPGLSAHSDFRRH
jgi:hypothetical protein